MGNKNKYKSGSIFDMQFITSSISTTLVLLLLGLVVFFVLTAHNLSVYVRENISFSILISDDMKEADILKLQKKLNGESFVKESEYISKKQALKEQTEAMGTDPKEFLGYNPFTASIEIKLHSDYANSDSIAKIEKMVKRNRNPSIGHALALTPCAVFGDGAAFFLGKAGHDSNEQFALAVQCPDIFLFKINLYPFFLQLTDGSKAVNCIACKAADRFCDDKVYFSVQSILHHAVEAVTVLGVSAGYALIGIYRYKLPIISTLDVVRVIIHLRFIAGELLLAVRRNTGIGGSAALFLFVNWCSCEPTDRCWNSRYFCHVFPSIFLSLLPAYAVSVLPSAWAFSS